MMSFENLGLFVFFFALACERIFIKMHGTESKFVIRPETILFLRCVRASFTLEIFQAVALKGLIEKGLTIYSSPICG